MTEQPTEDAWREMGRQFQALGENLAAAFRAAWEDEGNRQQLREMRVGLETMASRVGQTIDEAAASPEGQRARQEVEQAAHSAHAAGRQAWQDARPHVASALRQVIAELEKMASRMEEQRSVAEGEAQESAV
jgi:hypothetical protein